MGDVVRAAGGVLWRRADEGSLEVLLVHRPSYDDWSFPKGKHDRGETDEETALREVAEETGVVARLGPELLAVEYLDSHGRDKRVRYWAMTVESEEPREPDDEVDETVWLPAGDAEGALTYDRDVSVLQSLLDVVNRL